MSSNYAQIGSYQVRLKRVHRALSSEAALAARAESALTILATRKLSPEQKQSARVGAKLQDRTVQSTGPIVESPPKHSPCETIPEVEEEDLEEELGWARVGWRPPASWLCRGDERYLVELETDLRRCLQEEESMLPALLETRRAVVDMPGSVWLARPGVFLALLAAVGMGSRRVVLSSLETLLALLESVLGPALDSALDPAAACDIDADSRGPARRVGDRSEQARIAAVRRKREPHSQRLEDDEDDDSLAVSGACVLVFRTVAPSALRECSSPDLLDRACRAIASELMARVVPFVMEPTASSVDNDRVVACLCALEAAVNGGGEPLDADATLLALRLCCALRRAELPPALDRLAREAVADAWLAAADPSLRDAVSALVDPAVKAEADSAIADAKLAARLIESPLRLETLTDALSAAAAITRALSRLIIHKQDEHDDDASDDDFNATLLYGDDDDPGRDRVLNVLLEERTADARRQCLDASVAFSTAVFVLGCLAIDNDIVVLTTEIDATTTLADSALRLLIDAIERGGSAQRHCCEALLGRSAPANLVDAFFVSDDTRRDLFGEPPLVLATMEWRRRITRMLLSDRAGHLRSLLLRACAFSSDAKTRRAARELVSRYAATAPPVASASWIPQDWPWLQMLNVAYFAAEPKSRGLARALFSRDENVRKAAAGQIFGRKKDLLCDLLPLDVSVDVLFEPVKTGHQTVDLEKPAEQQQHHVGARFLETFETCLRLDVDEAERSLAAVTQDFCDEALASSPSLAWTSVVKDTLPTFAAAISDTAAPPVASSAALRVVLVAAWVHGSPLFERAGLLDEVIAALLRRLDEAGAGRMDNEQWRDSGDRACAACALAALLFNASGWWPDDKKLAAVVPGLLEPAVLEVFAPPCGRLLWGDGRLVWIRNAMWNRREEQLQGAMHEVGQRATSTQLAIDYGCDRPALSLGAPSICAGLAVASSRAQFCERLIEARRWLACRGALAKTWLAKADWHVALKRPLTSLPRGREERIALRYVTILLTVIADCIDVNDERLPALWSSTVDIVVPAALDPTQRLGEGSQRHRKHSRTPLLSVDDDALNDDIAASCCALVAVIAERWPALITTSGQVTGSVVRLLRAAPSPRMINAAMLVLDRELDARAAPGTSPSQRLIGTSRVEESEHHLKDIVGCVQTFANSRAPPDAFRGSGSLKLAVRCLFRAARLIKPTSKVFLDDRMAVRLAEMAWDRETDVRASTYALLAELDLGENAQRMCEIAAHAATDPTEAPLVRGAAMALLARASRRDSPVATSAAFKIVLSDFSNIDTVSSFLAPILWLGLAKLSLELVTLDHLQDSTPSGLELAARGVAVLMRYAADPAAFHGERYVSDVARCAGIDLVAANANAKSTHPALRAWAGSDRALLAGEGWNDVASRRWRYYAHVADAAAITTIRCARLIVGLDRASAVVSAAPILSSAICRRRRHPMVFAESADLLADLIAIDRTTVPDQHHLLSTLTDLLSGDETLAQTAAASRLVAAILFFCRDNFDGNREPLINELCDALVLTVHRLEEESANDDYLIENARDAASLALATLVDAVPAARRRALRDDRPVCPMQAALRRLNRSVAGLDTVFTEAVDDSPAGTRRRTVKVSGAARALVVCRALLLQSDDESRRVVAVASQEVAKALVFAWDPLESLRGACGDQFEDPFDMLIGSATNLACGDESAKRALTLQFQRKRSLAHRLMDLALRANSRSGRRTRDEERNARTANSAAACLRALAGSTSRCVLLQGTFMADLVVALRRLSATARVSDDELEPRRAARGRALHLLRLLVSATMFADAQRKVLDHPQTPDLLLDLVHYYAPSKEKRDCSPTSVVCPQKKTRETEHLATQFVALLLRNLALLRRNKARLLAQPALIGFLVSSVNSSHVPVLTAAASALWALLHHSEKARAILRPDAQATRRLDNAHRTLSHYTDQSASVCQAGFRAVLAITRILAGDDFPDFNRQASETVLSPPPERRRATFTLEPTRS